MNGKVCVQATQGQDNMQNIPVGIYLQIWTGPQRCNNADGGKIDETVQYHLTQPRSMRCQGQESAVVHLCTPPQINNAWGDTVGKKC